MVPLLPMPSSRFVSTSRLPTFTLDSETSCMLSPETVWMSGSTLRLGSTSLRTLSNVSSTLSGSGSSLADCDWSPFLPLRCLTPPRRPLCAFFLPSGAPSAPSVPATESGGGVASEPDSCETGCPSSPDSERDFAFASAFSTSFAAFFSPSALSAGGTVPPYELDSLASSGMNLRHLRIWPWYHRLSLFWFIKRLMTRNTMTIGSVSSWNVVCTVC